MPNNPPVWTFELPHVPRFEGEVVLVIETFPGGMLVDHDQNDQNRFITWDSLEKYARNWVFQ
jgi:hypothetical protein